MIPGWLVDRFVDLIFWIIIPALFIFLIILPFLIVKKVLKQRFNFPNIVGSIIVAAALVALYLYGLYWGLAYLQGLAACSLYGC